MPSQIISDTIENISRLNIDKDSRDLVQLNTLLQQTENLIVDFNGIGQGHAMGLLISSIVALLPISNPMAAFFAVGAGYFLGDFLSKSYLKLTINDLPDRLSFHRFLSHIERIVDTKKDVKKSIECVKTLNSSLKTVINNMSFNKEFYGPFGIMFSQFFCNKYSINSIYTLISNGICSTLAVKGASQTVVDATLEKQMENALTPLANFSP